MTSRDRSIIVMSLILVPLIGVCCPLVCIWALNTLFGLHIAYTFQTVVAVLILLGLARGGFTIKEQK